MTAFTQQFLQRGSNQTHVICEQGCYLAEDLPAVQRMQRWTYQRKKQPNDCQTEKPDFCRVEDGRYKPSGDVLSPCCISLNKVLDIMARLGYRRIYLLGFDGRTNSYFFEDSDRYPLEKNVYAALRRKHGLLPPNTTTHFSSYAPNQTGPSNARASKAHGKSRLAAMVTEFASYNGIRLVNLCGQGSSFSDHVESQSINDVVSDLMTEKNVKDDLL